MNYLGLDYGKSKIGVAAAQGSLAEPVATLNTESALNNLPQLLREWQAEQIIIGDCDPEFLTQLAALGVPVVTADETLSSHDARESLLHTTQKRRRENEHAVAAAIILQNWLDSQVQTR